MNYYLGHGTVYLDRAILFIGRGRLFIGASIYSGASIIKG